MSEKMCLAGINRVHIRNRIILIDKSTSGRSGLFVYSKENLREMRMILIRIFYIHQNIIFSIKLRDNLFLYQESKVFGGWLWHSEANENLINDFLSKSTLKHWHIFCSKLRYSPSQPSPHFSSQSSSFAFLSSTERHTSRHQNRLVSLINCFYDF